MYIFNITFFGTWTLGNLSLGAWNGVYFISFHFISRVAQLQSMYDMGWTNENRSN